MVIQKWNLFFSLVFWNFIRMFLKTRILWCTWENQGTTSKKSGNLLINTRVPSPASTTKFSDSKMKTTRLHTFHETVRPMRKHEFKKMTWSNTFYTASSLPTLPSFSLHCLGVLTLFLFCNKKNCFQSQAVSFTFNQCKYISTFISNIKNT